MPLRTLLAALLLFAPALHAELLSPAQFQERVQASRRPNERRPGVVAVSVRLGQPPLVASAGMRDLEERRPAGPDTAFLWFSVTKLFTATAVMQLAAEGKIDLDAPITRWLPDFKYDLQGWPAPTPAHLLSHTAGLPLLSVMDKFNSIHLAGEPRPATADLLQQWAGPGEKIRWEPGTRFEYSNLGYLWLGRLIEQVSGERYEDYITAHILKPLKMDHSGFSHPDILGSARGYARTHSFMGVVGALFGEERYDAGKVFGYRAIRLFEVDGPSYAGLIGTPRDMARFAAMMLGGGELDGVRILPADSVARMQAPRLAPDGTELRAGLGWWRGKDGGESVVFHEGTGAGYRTEVCLHPGQSYGMVVASNDTEYDTGAVCGWVVSAVGGGD